MSPLCRKPGSLWPLCSQCPREGWVPAAQQSQHWLPGQGAQSLRAKLWGKRWALLGGPEGLGGRGRKLASAGGGETPHSHGHTGAEDLPLPVDGPLPGQPEPGAAGAGSRAGGLLPAAQCGTPPTAAPRLRDQTCTWFPHTRGAQMSPLTGRRCHFVSFWQGRASRVQGCGGPHCRGPGSRSPPLWAT